MITHLLITKIRLTLDPPQEWRRSRRMSWMGNDFSHQSLFGAYYHTINISGHRLILSQID